MSLNSHWFKNGQPLTLFHLGFLTYVKTWGGAIMAPLNFSPYYVANKPLGGPNLIPNEYFDLQPFYTQVSPEILALKVLKNPKGGPFYVKKIFVSDSDETQNLKSLLPEDLTHEI